MSDPYKILGVTKSSTADEIKSAYRKLAKKLHPDVNPGKKDIEQKFKEVIAAYDLLSDATKRARFDRGEIDGQGNERGFSGGHGSDPFSGAGSGGGGWRGRSRSSGGGDPFGNVDDIFEQFMRGSQGRGGGRSTGGGHARGEDVALNLTVPFIEAALGGKKRVNLPSGKTIDINIPAGIVEGHKLRLRGLGETPTSDAIIEIHVQDHPFFTRKDFDINLEAPISIGEAVLGGSIAVPTLDGQVTLKVPQNASTGTVLRLKGKGIPKSEKEAGDMFVKLKIMLPETPAQELHDVIEKWAKKHAYDPRKKLGW